MKDTALIKNKNAFQRAVNRNRFCIYSFIISAAIMLFVYIAYKFIPFGRMTILRMDLYHQYGPLFAELYERLVHADSLIYSWTSGLGSSFTGNYLNYLASPLGNLVILIAGHDNMPEAIAVMVLLKAALSSATFTYFINNHFDRRDASSSAFSILYAFCGFFMAYYWNIMWLDGMVFFPLVILGICKIIDGKTPWLYLASLAAVMLTSYYMAYMICILSVIWFVFYYFSNYSFSDTMREYDLRFTKREYNSFSSEDKRKLARRNLINNRFIYTGLKFAGSSFLAFGIAAVALIPVYFVLKTCSATGNSFPSDYRSYFGIFDFLANHLAGVTPTIRSSGDDVLPNIYSGVLPLMLVPLFLFSEKINFKEKIASVCLLAVFYFSFNVNYLNFIWHGFHFPNDLPYRFSFAYTFFLLFLSYKAFMNLDSVSSKAIIGSGTAVIGFTILVQEIGSKNVMINSNGNSTASETVIWATIVFVVIYAVVLALIKNPKYMSTAMCTLLLCCTATEIIVVDTQNYEFQQEKSWFTDDYRNFKPLKEEIDAKEQEEAPNGFYRMELSQLRARMDPCWYYYNGVSVFSSMAYESVSKMMKDIGMFGNDVNSYTYYPQTPVFNAMFSLKYVFDNSQRISANKYYTELNSNETYTVYQTNYDLPIAFCVNPDLENWIPNGANPFDDQAAMWNLATGSVGLFKDLTITTESVDNMTEISDSSLNTGNFTISKISKGVFASTTLSVTTTESGNVYIYVRSADADTVMVNGPKLTKDVAPDAAYIVDCGYLEANETVTMEIQLPNDKDSADVKLYAVTINDAAFEQGYNDLLNSGTLAYTSFKEDRFSGTITAQEDKILYTSIPYDEGWHVTIDGMKVPVEDYIMIGNSLLAVPISAGEHTVEFKYTPKGMTVGIAMTCISVLILLAIACMKKKKILLFSEKSLHAITLDDFTPVIRIPLETDEAAESELSEFSDITESEATTAGQDAALEATEIPEMIEVEEITDETETAPEATEMPEMIEDTTSDSELE